MTACRQGKLYMKIIKRSGTEVPFDLSKITNAVVKANYSVSEDKRLSEEAVQEISAAVEAACAAMNRSMNVEEIQDLVENQIMKHQAYEVARNYITYRYKRALVRKANTTDEQIMSLLEFNNEEIRQEFQKTIREVKHAATLKRLEESEKLFMDTIQGHEEAVAAQIEKVHAEETVAIHYNKEDSLRSVIKLAYYAYRDHYLQFEELPAGEGFADVAYIPVADSDWPILLVELKWIESPESAISQIISRKYTYGLEQYGRPILLVGITYDKDAAAGQKKHSCKIVEYAGSDCR